MNSKLLAGYMLETTSYALSSLPSLFLCFSCGGGVAGGRGFFLSFTPELEKLLGRKLHLSAYQIS